MRVVEIGQEYKKEENDVVIFLSGGIHNADWRDKLVFLLSQYPHSESMVLIEPIVNNVDEKTRSIDELNMIDECDIFACYLSNDESKHPMSIFEIAYASKYYDKKILVTMEAGYSLASKLTEMTYYANYPDLRDSEEDLEEFIDGSDYAGIAFMMDDDGNVEGHAKDIYNLYLEVIKERVSKVIKGEV